MFTLVPTHDSRVDDGERAAEHAGSDEDYLAPGDVARLLCVSARTVSRWADQGRIPHLVTLGGHRRFRRAEVLKLVNRAHRAPHQPAA